MAGLNWSQAPDSLDHYVDCCHLRMVAGIFDDDALPHDAIASFYGIGPAAECPDAKGGIRWNVLACTAYHTVRARRRDCGPMAIADDDRLARQAASQAFPPFPHVWLSGAGRRPPATSCCSAWAGQPDAAPNGGSERRRERARADALADTSGGGTKPRSRSPMNVSL